MKLLRPGNKSPMDDKIFQIDQIGHFDLQRRPIKQLRQIYSYLEVSSTPQKGYRKCSLTSSQFTLTLGYAFVSSNGTARNRKICDTVAFTFDNLTMHRLIFQVSFFYNLSLANYWRLLSKF